MSKYAICYSGNIWYSMNIETEEYSDDFQLEYNTTYISFQVPDFIRLFKSKDRPYSPEIIDMQSLDKQFSQAGNDILKKGKWNIKKILRREGIIDYDYKVTDIKEFLIHVVNLYKKFMSNPEERPRFDDIEMKINKIIHKTELKGIRIDSDLLEERCEHLHSEIYKIKNIFQFDYNIFSPENYETQLEYLKSKNYKVFTSARKTVNLLRHSDSICDLFYELNRTSQDLKCLIFMSAHYGGEKIVYPHFIGFGTITSRIIMKEPSLQNLRKSNRDVIIPNQGKNLLYIDYKQFEAGILAHLSNDKKLLTLYNDDDIYNNMIKNLLKSEINDENRKRAKILFYRFLYGDDFSNESRIKKDVKNYFNEFEQLMKFKENLITKSKAKSKIESSFGNFRKLHDKEDNIWVLSHHVQSTASLIFKKALINVFENIRSARLLIPLHDGALYEINEDSYVRISNEIKNIFEQTLKEICPELTNASAEIKNFHENSILLF